MKKLLITALLSLMVLGLQAQKKVLKSAQKALNKKDYATAIDLAKEAGAHPETAENNQLYVILGTAFLYRFKDDKTDVSLAQTSFDHFQKAIDLGGEKVKAKLMEEVFMNAEGERLGGGEGLLYLQNLLNTQGNVHFEAEEYDRAYEYFLISSKIQPDDVVMAFYTGYSAYNSEKNEVAIEYYQKTIVLNEKAPEEAKFENMGFVYRGLIDIYFTRKKDFDKALEYIKLAKEAFPEEKVYKDIEIDVLIKADKLSDAITQLQEINNAGNGTVITYSMQARLQFNNDQSEEALAAANRALALDPNHYDALNIAGSVHFNEAVALLNAANNTDTSDTETYDKLLKEAKDKFRVALPLFEKSLEQKPTDTYSLNPLYTIYDQLDMDAKRDEVKAKLDALDGGE